VSYIDFLGFRSLLATDLQGVVPIMKAFVRAFSQFTRRDNAERPPVSAEAIAISDAIVRARPVADCAALYWELLSITHCIIAAVQHGFVVRGGMTFGVLHYDEGENVLVSSALVRAYELENQIAKYPRIVIDPRLISAVWSEDRLRASHHTAAQEWEHVTSLIRRDDDGWYFIDYLRASTSEFDEPSLDYTVFLETHKKLVVKGLRCDRPAVLEKYRWLERYHNAIIRELDAPKLFKHLITPDDPWVR
jgi:hypothetical protein